MMRAHRFLCALTLAASICAASPALAKGVMLMNRIGPSKMEVFVANADGTGERKLMPDSNFDYDATFSPDGKWIVFTSERDAAGTGQADIYRIHPDGSGLERLTSDPAMDDQAVLSPDGTKLAYVSTKGGAKTTNIWVMDLASKKAKRITGSASAQISKTMNSYFRPAWSPDGQWIAFSSDVGENWAGAERGAGIGHSQPLSIYVIKPDGSGLRRVTPANPARTIGSPSWSADGKALLAYEGPTKDTMDARMGGFAGTTTNIASQIVKIDVATGATSAVTTGAGIKLSPHFLPDGRVGYVIKAAPAEAPIGIAYSDGTAGLRQRVRQPSWSPDGKSVVYYKYDSANRAQYTQLYSWDKAREYRYTDVFPTLCKSSGKLALTDLDFPRGNPTASISVMNPDGTDRKKIYQRQDGASLMPTWSPDCQWLAVGVGTFFPGRDFRPANIQMVKQDGSETREITQGPLNVGFPAWMPDGKTIVYRVWGNDKGQDVRGLRSMNLETKEAKVLTTAWDNFPFVSPRGDRIVFTRRVDENSDFEVFTMKPDGSDVKRVTYTSGADAHATWTEDSKGLWFSSSRTGFKDEAWIYDTSPQPYAQVHLMNRDGSNARQLTDSKWEDSLAMYLPQN